MNHIRHCLVAVIALTVTLLAIVSFRVDDVAVGTVDNPSSMLINNPAATVTAVYEQTYLAPFVSSAIAASQTANMMTLFAEATGIISGITQTAADQDTLVATQKGTGIPPSVVSATSTPTLTPLPSLSMQVGFSDPELDSLQAKGETILAESLTFDGNNHHYRLLTIWNAEQRWPGSILLYQIDSKPILLWKDERDPRLPRIADIEAPAPGQWNNDGKTFFAVNRESGGNQWTHSMYYIYEIKSDGSVSSRLKGVIAPGFIVSKITRPTTDQSVLITAIDVQGDEIIGPDNCCPSITRYYIFRNDAIVDDTVTHLSEYLSDIGSIVFSWTTIAHIDAANAPLYAGDLLELLMIYDVTDQRAAGWQLVQSLVSDAKQSQRLTDGTYIDTTFMPAMAKLYRENKRFVAPSRVDDNSGDWDYYAGD